MSACVRACVCMYVCMYVCARVFGKASMNRDSLVRV